jgi:hypothetical protein
LIFSHVVPQNRHPLLRNTLKWLRRAFAQHSKKTWNRAAGVMACDGSSKADNLKAVGLCADSQIAFAVAKTQIIAKPVA